MKNLLILKIGAIIAVSVIVLYMIDLWGDFSTFLEKYDWDSMPSIVIMADSIVIFSSFSLMVAGALWFLYRKWKDVLFLVLMYLSVFLSALYTFGFLISVFEPGKAQTWEW